IYVCGEYMKTGGATCENNAVDGEALLRFTLKTLVQLVARPGNREKLRDLLLERARQEALEPSLGTLDQEIQVRTARVEELRGQKNAAQRRMARETSDLRYEALGEEFDRIGAELGAAEKELEAELRRRPAKAAATPEAEVEAALAVLEDVTRIATDTNARAEINPFLKKLGVWIGLHFVSAVKGKKRVVRRLQSGVITFGKNTLPVPL